MILETCKGMTFVFIMDLSWDDRLEEVLGVLIL